MAMRGGWHINGKHFRETHSSGALRYTRRYFIDGKQVTRAIFYLELELARKILARKIEAERAEAVR